MPLNEQSRSKLDGIVMQMESNKETPETIQAVVNDFKSKYDAPATPTPASAPKSVGGFARNTVNSAGSMIGNVASAVMNPMQTMMATGDTLEGLANQYVPGFQRVKNALGADANVSAQQNALADNLKKNIADRYGSLGKFGETLYSDPVGVLSDIATFADGAGLALKGTSIAAKAGKAGELASLAGKGSDVASRVGATVNPITLAGKGVSRAASTVGAKLPGANEVAGRLYQSALKPPPGSYSLDDVRKMTKTGLENSIPVSEAGVQRLSGLIDDLNTKIKNVIASDPRAQIDPTKVAGRVDQVKPKFANQVNPEADVAALENSKNEFLRQTQTPGQAPRPTGVLDAQGNPIMTAGTPPTSRNLTGAEAQDMKRNTYKQLKDRSYGELKGAQIEAQKALARGLKEEIASAFPEVEGLNAKESELLGLDKALERAVRRIDNHNILGIGTPIAAEAAAGIAGGGAGLVAGVLKSVIDTPAIKSRLGIALAKAAKTKGISTSGSITTRINSYINALGDVKARTQE